MKFHLLKIFLLLGSFGVSNVAWADGYDLLKKSESGGLYYVKGSFDNSGKSGHLYPTVTVLINNRHGYDTPKGEAHSVLLFLMLNCPNKLQVVSSGIYYSGAFTEGVKVYQDNDSYSTKMFKSIENRFCQR